nr:cytochrome P450 [Deltaproteobacteria bacterium]
ETTRNLIAGGMLALLNHPAELARLRADPALLGSAVEEMLRYVSPVTEFRRTANRDIELHGKTLREGDRVILVHASANRDERVFADPDRFDITRSPNQHLAFGVGPHLCIGATLARLEARCMFDEIIRRLSDIEICGPVVRMHSNLVNGYKQMPVRFRVR